MLQQIVDDYLKLFPDDRKDLTLLLKQMSDGDVLNNRKTMPGHVTGSALVLSPDKTKILLIYHKLFNKWLQPGGHWDPEDSNPRAAARREAVEETSVKIAKQLPAFGDNLQVPLSISSHTIPARPEKQEAEHTHHDLRYVFLAADETLSHQAEEVHAAAWFSFDAPECANIAYVIARIKKYVLER